MRGRRPVNKDDYKPGDILHRTGFGVVITGTFVRCSLTKVIVRKADGRLVAWDPRFITKGVPDGAQPND